MLNKSVFVTGATGSLGRVLIKDLLPRGCRITLLCRKRIEEFDKPNVNIIEGDLLDVRSYIFGLKGVNAVLHMAAVTHTNDVKKYYRINADATLELIKACKISGVGRFIYISSRAASDEGGDYSRSKLMAERHVQESGLNWVTLRLAEVYGLSGKEGVDMILKNIQRFPIVPVIGSGKYTLAPVHVSDAIAAIMSVIEDDRKSGKIYNIAGPESFTYNEFIDKVLKLKRIKRVKWHMPLSILNILARVLALFSKDKFFAIDQLPRLLCRKSDDISLAKSELCFRPARFEDAVKAGVTDV